MRLALTVFGHTLTIDTRIDCPDDDGVERDRDTQLDSLVETVGNKPDPRAELDHRVRPEAFGFRP